MFKKDQGKIARFASKKPENVAKVAEFVLLTIQRRFIEVERHYTGELPIIGMTGITRKGIEFAYENSGLLHQIIYTEGLTLAERILGVMQTPGLAIVKSGFVIQLCRGECGCLDTHNIRMYGLDKNSFNGQGTIPAITKRIHLYIQTCERLGGSEKLWNTWCKFIADKYSERYEGKASIVSKLHTLVIR